MQKDSKPTKSVEEKYCSSCGEIIKKEAEICPKCGVRQMSPKSGMVKSKIVAGLLALLLGGIGIHKFYLGKPIGILYLFFFWTFIPAIVALVEGIIYLTFSGTDEEFTEKYAK